MRKIILDTDMGSDCDDAGALALLHVYADRGEAEILGCIYSSGRVPFGAGVIDAINTWYGRPDIPIGAAYDEEVGDPIDKMGAGKLARDTAAFKHRVITNRDAAEQTALNRQLLAEQDDRSITYVTIGHTKGLHDLLRSGPDAASPLTGHELVARKLDAWIALGALCIHNSPGTYHMDWNFCCNNTSPCTAWLVQECPVPVFYVDAGATTLTGKGLKDTPPGNIVRTAYRDWLWNAGGQTLDDQRPSWDLAAVYFAVEGFGCFLESVGTGWLEVDAKKGCCWHPGHDSKRPPQAFVVQKSGTDEVFADYLNAMLAMPPAHRRTSDEAVSGRGMRDENDE